MSNEYESNRIFRKDSTQRWKVFTQLRAVASRVKLNAARLIFVGKIFANGSAQSLSLKMEFNYVSLALAASVTPPFPPFSPL